MSLRIRAVTPLLLTVAFIPVIPLLQPTSVRTRLTPGIAQETPVSPPPATTESSPPPEPELRPPSDDEIREAVTEALRNGPGIQDRTDLRVECRDGVVTLTGSARTLSRLRQAERLAGQVRGVLEVLTKAAISTAGLPDSRILLSVENSLRAPAFQGDRISALVRNGQIRLSGTTATYARKLLAERITGEIEGTVEVVNNLAVTAHAEGDDAALALRIRSLLASGLSPVPGRFEVTVRGRRVFLEGDVPLLSHRVQAERLAFSVGGIRAVENRLKVNPSLRLPPSATVEITP